MILMPFGEPFDGYYGSIVPALAVAGPPADIEEAAGRGAGGPQLKRYSLGRTRRCAGRGQHDRWDGRSPVGTDVYHGREMERYRMADSNGPVPTMKLELVPVPVSDVDRAKAFYQQAGFKLEVDVQPTDTMRVVLFTPPGSACTIVFGTGMGKISEMQPGSLKGLHLSVRQTPEQRRGVTWG